MLGYLAFFPEILDQLKMLNKEERCDVYESMMRYAFFEEEPDFSESAMCQLAWGFIKPKIDAAARKSAIQSANGERGGRPQKPNESQEKPTKANRNPTKAKKSQEKP